MKGKAMENRIKLTGGMIGEVSPNRAEQWREGEIIAVSRGERPDLRAIKFAVHCAIADVGVSKGERAAPCDYSEAAADALDGLFGVQGNG